MRSEILKYFSFLFTLILISCGGGGGDDGGGGGGGPVDPPPPTPPGKSTLVAPANNKTCEGRASGPASPRLRLNAAMKTPTKSSGTNTEMTRLTPLKKRQTAFKNRSIKTASP